MSRSIPVASTHSPILWGAYLACSWTWCIGMFLPALLLRDMGWPGFLIFAIPNVAGAAAMGWVLKSRISSTRFVKTHPAEIWWFSAITIAFHLFWLLWIVRLLQQTIPMPGVGFLAGLGIALLFGLVLKWGTRHARVPYIALALLLFSLCVLLYTFESPALQKTNAALLDSTHHTPAPLWMLPVMLFGFLLCPYLDITFHHARQQLDTKKNGRLGFTIGFAAFFTPMILLTTRYAGTIAAAMEGHAPAPPVTAWLATGILIHILCQWLFTVCAHLDRIQTLPGAKSKRLLLPGLAGLAGFVGLLTPHLPSHAGLTGSEIVYRLFMSAYGLVFPAYVLYRIVMARKAPSIIRPAALWIVVALASPMFWMGFIERQPVWLIPGMGLLLLGTLMRRPKQFPARQNHNQIQNS